MKKFIRIFGIILLIIFFIVWICADITTALLYLGVPLLAVVFLAVFLQKNTGIDKVLEGIIIGIVIAFILGPIITGLDFFRNNILDKQLVKTLLSNDALSIYCKTEMYKNIVKNNPNANVTLPLQIQYWEVIKNDKELLRFSIDPKYRKWYQEMQIYDDINNHIENVQNNIVSTHFVDLIFLEGYKELVNENRFKEFALEFWRDDQLICK